MTNYRIPATLAIAALSACLLLVGGCTGSALGNSSVVSAQQNYSTASLAGAYSVNESGSEKGVLHDGSGTLQLDGNGNLAGTITDYYEGGTPCRFSFAGSYTVSSTAGGTASLTATPTTPDCSGRSGSISLQVGQQGQSFVFAERDGLRIDTGTALKQ